jgi:hypothetical protein
MLGRADLSCLNQALAGREILVRFAVTAQGLVTSPGAVAPNAAPGDCSSAPSGLLTRDEMHL